MFTAATLPRVRRGNHARDGRAVASLRRPHPRDTSNSSRGECGRAGSAAETNVELLQYPRKTPYASPCMHPVSGYGCTYLSTPSKSTRFHTPAKFSTEPPIMPSDLDARRRSGRRVATLAPRPSQPDGALAPPSPQRSHSPPPPQTELQVCACAAASAGQCDTPSHIHTHKQGSHAVPKCAPSWRLRRCSSRLQPPHAPRNATPRHRRRS